MSITKNKLFILGVLVAVSATAGAVVLGKQEVVEKNVIVKVVNFTKTYQDFQNAPVVDGAKILPIFNLPVDSEILSAHAVIKEQWLPESSLEEVFFMPTFQAVDDELGCLLANDFEGELGFEVAKTSVEAGKPVMILNDFYCNEAIVFGLKVEGTNPDKLNDFTHGSMEFIISYLVH